MLYIYLFPFGTTVNFFLLGLKYFLRTNFWGYNIRSKHMSIFSWGGEGLRERERKYLKQAPNTGLNLATLR